MQHNIAYELFQFNYQNRNTIIQQNIAYELFQFDYQNQKQCDIHDCRKLKQSHILEEKKNDIQSRNKLISLDQSFLPLNYIGRPSTILQLRYSILFCN